MKETWNVLNRVINEKYSSHSDLPNVFVDNGKEIKGEDIADGFNNFFVNVGPRLASTIPDQAGSAVYDYLDHNNPLSMFLAETSETEILEIVKNCKSKTSADCNDLSMLLLKEIINYVIKPFTHICNLSFLTGVFPNNMKVAKVIPIFKNGNVHSFSNYRPISLLPQFSKVLEKLFDKRMDTFIGKYNLLNDSQYGFRSGRSTSMALLQLNEELTHALDSKLSTVGVFIDLKKAFDTIDHLSLLKKLEYYGFRGIVHKWLTSYLSNRKQYVHVGNVNSNTRDMVCGVPQGSILGPKLFILYINDICSVSKIMKFVLFADDTNIFCSHPDISTLCTLVSAELLRLSIWFHVNKLSLNVDKTHFMIFSNSVINLNVQIHINGRCIDRVAHTKFLGILIDDKLNWKPHISHFTKKLSKCNAVLYRASKV